MEEENNVVEENKVETGKFDKLKKNIIMCAIIAVIAIIAIIVINLVKPSPKKTVKEFVKYMDKHNFKKAYALCDFVGLDVFDEDNLEDFVEDYKDAKDDDDDYEEMMDEIIEAAEDQAEDMEKYSLELKKIKSVSKVKKAKKMYKVKTQIKVTRQEDEDDKADKETGNVTFYVYKTGGKYKIVGYEDEEGVLSLSSYNYNFDYDW